MLLFPLTAPTINSRLSENTPVSTVCYSIIFGKIFLYAAFIRIMIGFVKKVGWTTELDSS